MTSNERVVVIGAGGHGKVVLSTLASALVVADAFYDDDPAKWGTTIHGVPVRGPVRELVGRRGVRGVVAIGDNRRRSEIAASLDLEWLVVVHARAYVDPHAHLGAGTVVFAGAVVQPDAVIGRHAIVDTAATVDHDCAVGDYVHVAPGSHLAGMVRVGEGVLLGTGSAVNPGRTIGAWSVVGSGSVVVRDLPEGVVAVGAPARTVRLIPLPARTEVR